MILRIICFTLIRVFRIIDGLLDFDFFEKVFLEALEVVLEEHFVEFQAGGFEEAVFEIIEVEVDGAWAE